MDKITSEKKNVSLSLNKEVNEILTQLAKRNDMTKSALVTYLVRKLDSNGNSGLIYED